jgi:predicted dehydrogenase
MLKSGCVDAVVVALANRLHRPIAVDALRAGKHVLVEKPMATSAREAQEMVNEARKARRTLMVAMCNRFRSDAQYARRFVESGKLGLPYLGHAMYWRRHGIPGSPTYAVKKNSGGGAIIDIGVHFLDLMLWIMGWPKVLSVSGAAFNKFGHTQSFKMDVDDYGGAFLRLAGGAVATLEVSWALHGSRHELSDVHVYGDKAGVELNPLRIMTVDEQGSELDIQPKLPGTQWAESFAREDDHFARQCLAGKPVIPTGEQGRDMMLILDAIYESARLGREVRIGRGR